MPSRIEPPRVLGLAEAVQEDGQPPRRPGERRGKSVAVSVDVPAADAQRHADGQRVALLGQSVADGRIDRGQDKVAPRSGPGGRRLAASRTRGQYLADCEAG